MIRSMTGYGRSQASVEGSRIELELRSVNHRYCEIAVRLPKPLSSLEAPVKKRLQQRFARGRLDLQVTLNGTGEYARRLEMDLDLAQQYRRLYQVLKTRLKIKGEIDLALFTNFRNIITVTERSLGSKRLVHTFYRLLDQAARRLEQMRRREGRALARDLIRRLQRIRRSIGAIKRRVPKAVIHYQRQLQIRINRLTEGMSLDPRRLGQEVAFYATRCDVSEEVTRLESHLSQFETMVRAPAAVGRSLDFVIQEMHREVNTAGSKADDVYISRQVILIKSELEKLREQVQNVE